MFRLTFVALQCYFIVVVAVGVNAQSLKITVTDPAQEAPTPTVDPQELHCLTEAVYFEGRNQTLEGMFAIASVILNRKASPDFPDTVCGVVHQGPMDGGEIERNRCQFSYYCDGKSDLFPVNDEQPEIEAAAWSAIVAELALDGSVEDNTNGSTYYHATYVDPFWNDVYDQVASVDDHLFYVHVR